MVSGFNPQHATRSCARARLLVLLTAGAVSVSAVPGTRVGRYESLPVTDLGEVAPPGGMPGWRAGSGSV